MNVTFEDTKMQKLKHSDLQTKELTQLPKSVTEETILDIHHWTEDLFSFRLTRPSEFRFRSGEFVMIGLMDEQKPILRAYSIASPSWDDGLNFYSIKVSNGPLTSRLQHLKKGEKILLGRKPTGTLVLDALKPGKRLFLLSTGTGVAPFASILREPETYEKFDEVILTQTCRGVSDLNYSAAMIKALKDDPLVGDEAPGRVKYYATTTRETSSHMGRITDLMQSGKFFSDLTIPKFDSANDRVMICGSTAMITDTKNILQTEGLNEGSNAAPGEFVVEKAFVA